MNKNFAIMVLQTVSHTRAEACPPPCVNTTNKLQPFGHRRGKKISTRPMRFAQPEAGLSVTVRPSLPLACNSLADAVTIIPGRIHASTLGLRGDAPPDGKC